MTATADAQERRPAPVLGSPLGTYRKPAARTHTGKVIVVKDSTRAGTWTGARVDYGLGAAGPKTLLDTVWSMKYAGLFFHNRSPWVERDYADAIEDIKLLGPHDAIPAGAWVHELLDASDQEGAIGYHEGRARVTKTGASGAHAMRGIALHPDTGTEIVVMKTFVATARQDHVYVTEVATHELFEAIVDPYVDNDAEIRAYLNPADGKEYIAEVGDPVQERAFDLGEPEGRPCGVPEAMVADEAYPSWWGQPQTRPYTSLAAEFRLSPNLAPFEIAPGGYMSSREPGGEWEQSYGSKHADHKPNPE